MTSSPPSDRPSSPKILPKQTLVDLRNKRIEKYEAKLAAKAAAGHPNDDYIRKWRGPKGARYWGYSPGRKTSRSKKRSESPTLFTDFPAEIVQRIALYSEEKAINALACCNSVYYKWLNQILYERNIKTGGSSALFWAAANGSLNTVRQMITFGADLHLATNNHSRQYCTHPAHTTGTALHVAIKFGHFDIVSLLLKKGLDLEQRAVSDYSDASSTPLELAIIHNHLHLGLLLIGKGAKINRGIYYTPLQRILLWYRSGANYEGSISFEDQMLWLQTLMQRGADVNFPAHAWNMFGENTTSPLALAFMWAHCWKTDSDQKRAPFLVDALLENGADVHTPISKGALPLHLAALMGWDDIVKYLLEHGAKSDVQAQDWMNQTPLHYALAMTCTRLRIPEDEEYDLCPFKYESFLIMDRDSWNDSNGTSGTYGSWDENKYGVLKWRGSVEIVNLLLENGADLDAKRSDGMTPRMLAAQNNDRSFRAALAGGLIKLNKEKDDGKVAERSGEDEVNKGKKMEDQSVEEQSIGEDPSGGSQDDHSHTTRASLFGGCSNVGAV